MIFYLNFGPTDFTNFVGFETSPLQYKLAPFVAIEKLLKLAGIIWHCEIDKGIALVVMPPDILCIELLVYNRIIFYPKMEI